MRSSETLIKDPDRERLFSVFWECLALLRAKGADALWGAVCLGRHSR